MSDTKYSRAIKKGLYFFSRLVFAAIVATALIIIRLAYSPVSVPFLAETVAKPFRVAFQEQKLSYSDAMLGWNWQDFAFEFSLENLLLEDKNNIPIAQFPKIAVGFSLENLFLGHIIPVRVDFYGPDLVIDWSSRQLEQKLTKVLEQREKSKSPVVLPWLRRLLEGKQTDSALRMLKHINIREANIHLRDRDTGVVWTLPNSEFSFHRTGGPALAEGHFTLVTEGNMVKVQLHSSRDKNNDLRLDLNVIDVNPTRLAEEVGLGSFFQSINMPLSGTFSVVQNRFGDINAIEMDLSGGPGNLFFGLEQKISMAVDIFSIKASIDLLKKEFLINNMYAGVDGANIQGDGIVFFTDDSDYPSLSMVLSADNVSMVTLLKIWPGGETASGGRLWLEENIPYGKIRNLAAQLNFNSSTWKMRPLPNEAFRVAFQFEDGEIHYLRPMPPLTRASGNMIITGNSLNANVLSGGVSDLDVSGLTFRIVDLTKRKSQIGEARFQLSGQLYQILSLLDQEPLKVLSKRNLTPSDYFGKIALQAVLNVPLSRGVQEPVTYSANAHVEDTAIPSIISDGGLSKGIVDAQITEKGLVATGKGHLRDAPINFHWIQNFGPSDNQEFTTQIELNGNFSDRDLKRFGAPDDLVMGSTASVQVSLLGLEGKLKKGKGKVNFRKTSADSDKLDWHKPPNTKADGSFTLLWTDDELQIPESKFTSPELLFSGSFAYDALSGFLKKAEISRYITGKNNFKLSAKQYTDGILGVLVEARSLNASNFIKTMFNESDASSSLSNVNIALRAEEIFALNDVVIKNFSIEAEQRQGFWTRANMIGALDTGGAVQLSLSYEKNLRHLRFDSDNAGRVALGLDLFRNAEGGKIQLLADLNVFNDQLTAKGVLAASDVHLVRSSALIEAIAQTRTTGLDAIIQPEGVNFRTLSFPFTLSNDIFDISGGQASGSSFGFTIEGQIDQTFERMNLNGVLVPAYTLNSLLGRIPVIGDILTGGEGKGIFSLNYRVSGNRNNPKIDFNPVSVITPGILRLIVGYKKGEISSDTAALPSEDTNDVNDFNE